MVEKEMYDTYYDVYLRKKRDEFGIRLSVFNQVERSKIRKVGTGDFLCMINGEPWNTPFPNAYLCRGIVLRFIRRKYVELFIGTDSWEDLLNSVYALEMQYK